jgi:hypothetical protein
METVEILALKVNNVQTVKDVLKELFVSLIRDRKMHKEKNRPSILENSIISTLIMYGVLEGKVNDLNKIEYVDRLQAGLFIEKLIKSL